MRIILVLRSDFGRPDTSGIRAYHIVKLAKRLFDGPIRVITRKSFKKLDGVEIIHTKTYLLSRLLSLLRKKVRSIRIASYLQKLDIAVFRAIISRYIPENGCIVHFFERSPAHMYPGNINIQEGYPPPEFVEELLAEGHFIEKQDIRRYSALREAYRKSDIVISPSSFVTSQLSRYYPEKQTSQIEYGVDSKSLAEPEKPVYLYAGGLKPSKGLIVLLDAWEKFLQAGCEGRLVVLGRMYNLVEGGMKFIKKRYSGDLLKTVSIEGFKSNIDDYYKKTYVYVFPSYHEGSSKTIFEAMACGIPVITTPNSGSIVEDGKTGFIVPIGDKDAVYEKMRYLHSNPHIRNIMGLEAREKARQFTWERYAQRVCSLYEQMKNNKNLPDRQSANNRKLVLNQPVIYEKATAKP